MCYDNTYQRPTGSIKKKNLSAPARARPISFDKIYPDKNKYCRAAAAIVIMVLYISYI